MIGKDIWVYILSYLSNPTDLCSVFRSCKFLNSIQDSVIDFKELKDYVLEPESLLQNQDLIHYWSQRKNKVVIHFCCYFYSGNFITSQVLNLFQHTVGIGNFELANHIFYLIRTCSTFIKVKSLYFNHVVEYIIPKLIMDFPPERLEYLLKFVKKWNDVLDLKENFLTFFKSLKMTMKDSYVRACFQSHDHTVIGWILSTGINVKLTSELYVKNVNCLLTMISATKVRQITFMTFVRVGIYAYIRKDYSAIEYLKGQDVNFESLQYNRSVALECLGLGAFDLFIGLYEKWHNSGIVQEEKICLFLTAAKFMNRQVFDALQKLENHFKLLKPFSMQEFLNHLYQNPDKHFVYSIFEQYSPDIKYIKKNMAEVLNYGYRPLMSLFIRIAKLSVLDALSYVEGCEFVSSNINKNLMVQYINKLDDE